MSVDDLSLVWSGAVVMWAFRRPDGTPSSFIHRTFSRETWRQASLWLRLQICVAFLLRPAVVIALAAYFTWYNASDVKRATGKGILRQFWEQVALGLTRPVLPPWYYIFELHDDAKRRRAGQYLNRFEMKSFTYKFLRTHSAELFGEPSHTAEFLSNKAAFAIRCRQFGLAAVPALLVAERGEVRGVDGAPPAFPEADVFFKPLRGNGGKGAERWEFLGGGRYRDAKGAVLNAAGLLDHLKALSLERDYVVRPRVVNCAAVSDLSRGTLTTVRVMTCRDGRGACEVTNAVFRMARGGTIVDNFHAGGIVSKVNLASGTLGRAVEGGFQGTGTGWHEHHPDTGAPILGRELPFWERVKELTRQAHATAFADHAIVGWDVALLEDGPALVEGNKGPCVDLIQKPHGEPLGDARLGELIAANLRRAVEIADRSR